MLDLKVLNMNGEEVGTLSLSEAVFGVEPNTVATSFRTQLQSCRRRNDRSRFS